MEKFKDKKIVIRLLIISTIVISIVGAYAYFLASVGETENEKLIVKAGTMQLVFRDTDELVTNTEETLNFGDTITKEFEIENTGMLTAYAKISWDNLINTYLEESLTYKLEYKIKASEEKIIEEKNKEKADDINISTSPVPPVNSNNDPDCAGLLGPDMTLIVQNIFKTIQYAGPILVAIFTTIDMIKAAFSGEQDDIKKAKNKFVKRLIAAICLFFIPIICNLIFGIAGITVPDTCIK